jgi:hypothetical protein
LDDTLRFLSPPWALGNAPSAGPAPAARPGARNQAQDGATTATSTRRQNRAIGLLSEAAHAAGSPRCRCLRLHMTRAAGSASASESRSPQNLPAAMLLVVLSSLRHALVVHKSTRSIHFKFQLASIGVTVGPSLQSVLTLIVSGRFHRQGEQNRT